MRSERRVRAQKARFNLSFPNVQTTSQALENPNSSKRPQASRPGGEVLCVQT